MTRARSGRVAGARLLARAGLCGIAAALCACGSGGGSLLGPEPDPPGGSPEPAGMPELAPAPLRLFGLNFGPFLGGADPSQGATVSEQDLWDLLQVVRGDARWLRTFGVSGGLEAAGRLIHEVGARAAIGAWIGPDPAANAAEIATLIDLALRGEVDLAIVGTEVLLRGDLSAAELIAHVEHVRAALAGKVPVSTAEVYTEYLARPELVAAVDVLLVNVYPYWEGVPIELAVREVHCRYEEVARAAAGKPIVIAETGWPSGGDAVGLAVPSPESAAAFFQGFASWARALGVAYFYFEAFDEAWKATYEGPQGAHWGIRFEDGSLKPGMERFFAGELVKEDWVDGLVPGGPGMPAIEFSFVPPIGSFEDLLGRIRHAPVIDCAVAVYVRVAGGWWTKPTFAEPLTPIRCGGGFVCDITTGGSDELATHVAAFLLPAGVDPPLLAGSPSLPARLYDLALAWVEVDRTR